MLLPVFLGHVLSNWGPLKRHACMSVCIKKNQVNPSVIKYLSSKTDLAKTAGAHLLKDITTCGKFHHQQGTKNKAKKKQRKWRDGEGGKGVSVLK